MYCDLMSQLLEWQKAQVSLLHNRNEVDDRRSFLLRKTFLVETFQWNFFVCSAELNCSTSVWPLFSSKASSKMAPQPKEWVGLYFMLSITHPHTQPHAPGYTLTYKLTNSRTPSETLAHTSTPIPACAHTHTNTPISTDTHPYILAHTHTLTLCLFKAERM